MRVPATLDVDHRLKSLLLVALSAMTAIAFILALGVSRAWAFGEDVSTYTLDNGMQVVVIPDHRVPVVTHMVWYKVGSADEVQGKTGLAHFLEHLMFKGTKKVAPGDFSKIIRVNGGTDNAFTTKDYTAYYQRIAKDRLPLVMELEADRMANLQLTDKDVKTELEVVKEERRMRTDNDPASLLAEQVDAALYVAHPYRRPTVGWMSEVAKLTRDDAMAFYHKYYTPQNAILIVAGDVTGDEVLALAKKYYGVLPNTANPGPRHRTAEPKPIAARRVMMADARVTTPSVMREYTTPSYSTAKPGEAEALDLLGQILGGGTTSRFYRDLVVQQKVASSAGAWYSGDGLDGGSFGLYAAPVPGGKPATAEAAMDKVIARVIQDGITQEELDRARNSLIADTIYALDSQYRLTRIYGTALTTGSTVDDVRQWTSRIEKVSVADVNAAARKFLNLDRSVTGVLEPAAHKEAAAAKTSVN